MAYYNVGDCDLFAISIVYSLYRCSYIINATESYRVVLPTPRRLCFHRCSLVSLFVNRITQKTTQPIFTKFGGRVAHGPRKKPLYFDGNLDHVMLALWLGLGYG